MKWPSAEMITAASAVIVGIAALFVAAEQSKIAKEQADIMRETAHASVWPVVQLDYSYYVEVESPRADFTLRNSGSGPAFIMGVSFTDGDKRLDSIEQFFRAAQSEFASLEADIRRADAVGRVIAAGEEVAIMQAEWIFNAEGPDDELQQKFWEFFQYMRDLKTEVCYCSGLERCWITSNQSETPLQLVETCNGFESGAF